VAVRSRIFETGPRSLEEPNTEAQKVDAGKVFGKVHR